MFNFELVSLQLIHSHLSFLFDTQSNINIIIIIILWRFTSFNKTILNIRKKVKIVTVNVLRSIFTGFDGIFQQWNLRSCCTSFKEQLTLFPQICSLINKIIQFFNSVLQSTVFLFGPSFANLTIDTQIISIVTKMAFVGPVNKAKSIADIGVQSRNTLKTAINTMRHDTSLVINSLLIRTNQRSTSISSTSIFTFFSSSAIDGFVQVESLSDSGGSQSFFTGVVINHVQFDAFQNHLVDTFSAKLVLAPSGDETILASVYLTIQIWETYCIDIPC